MQDRNVEFPNRYRMVKVEGTDDIFDLIPAPGEISNEGTFINKATLLKDATAALFGLGADAVPDDVLSYLGQYSQHWWRLTGKVQVNEYGEAAVQNVCYTGSSGTMKKFTYGTGFTVDKDLNVTLTDTSFFWYTPSDISAEKLSVLKGKYFFYNNEGTETAPLLYCLPTSRDAKNQYNYWSMTCQIITPMWKDDGETLVQSNDRNAYPDSGMVDSTVYQYLGIPFQKFPTMPQIATGSYTGTGKYGASKPNSLAFDFAPVMVFVYDTEVSIGNANTFVAFIGATVSSGENSNNTRFYTLNKKTLSWYNNKSVTGQLNNSGTTYYYIAIG